MTTAIINNLRLGILSGEDYAAVFEKWKGNAPNILLAMPERDAETRIERWESIAEYALGSGAQLVLPFHQDALDYAEPTYAREWTGRANAYLESRDSASRVAYPQRYKWYDVSMRISLDETM